MVTIRVEAEQGEYWLATLRSRDGARMETMPCASERKALEELDGMVRRERRECSKL
jgi:hypothetical protein